MAKYRFSDKVVTFAVSMRARGMKWKAIRDSIREEFKITPPTERRMRDWVKLYEQIQTQKTANFVSVKVPKRIMNSPTKPASPGRPTLARVAIMNTVA